MENGLQVTNYGLTHSSGDWQIAKAIDSPLVNQVGGEIVFAALNMAVAKAYIDTGFKAPDSKNQTEAAVYAQMINELVVYVKERLAGLRVNEIPIAISRGSLGEYSEFMGLNKKSFVQFLNGYKQSEDRLNVLASRNQPKEQSILPTLEEQFNLHKANTINLASVHHNSEQLSRAGSYVYDFLYSIGLLNYSAEENTKTFDQARKLILKEQENKRVVSTNFERFNINQAIDSILAGPKTGSKEYSLIESKAKALTVQRFFADVYMVGENTVEALVEAKREVFYNLKNK